MKTIKHRQFKRLSWFKVTGVILTVVLAVGLVVGLFSVATWAGEGTDYNGSNLTQSAPVTTGEGDKKTSSVRVQIIAKDNVNNGEANQAPKKLSDNSGNNQNTAQPGAVNITDHTSLPQTGEVNDRGFTMIGMALLGLIVIINRNGVVGAWRRVWQRE